MPAIVSKLLSLSGIVSKQGAISLQEDPTQPGAVITTDAYLNIAFIGAIIYTEITKDIGWAVKVSCDFGISHTKRRC